MDYLIISAVVVCIFGVGFYAGMTAERLEQRLDETNRKGRA